MLLLSLVLHLAKQSVFKVVLTWRNLVTSWFKSIYALIIRISHLNRKN